MPSVGLVVGAALDAAARFGADRDQAHAAAQRDAFHASGVLHCVGGDDVPAEGRADDEGLVFGDLFDETGKEFPVGRHRALHARALGREAVARQVEGIGVVAGRRHGVEVALPALGAAAGAVHEHHRDAGCAGFEHPSRHAVDLEWIGNHARGSVMYDFVSPIHYANRLFTKVAFPDRLCQGDHHGPSSISQDPWHDRAGSRRLARARPGPADPHRAALYRRADGYGVAVDRGPHAENAGPPRDHRQPPWRRGADRDALRPGRRAPTAIRCSSTTGGSSRCRCCRRRRPTTH